MLGSGGVILHFPGCFPEEAQSPSWRRGSTCTRTWCKIPVLQCCRLGFLRVRGFQALSWEVELPPELPGASRSVASASCPHGRDRAAWPGLQHPLLRSQTALQPPWECRGGKVSCPRWKIFPTGCSMHWLLVLLLPGALWSCPESPFLQGLLLPAAWGHKGGDVAPARNSFVALEDISGSLGSSHGRSFIPPGKERVAWSASDGPAEGAVEDQPRGIKNLFAGNPTGFPVMQRGSAACSVPAALNTDDRTRTGSLCHCPEWGHSCGQGHFRKVPAGD